jgi:hypothetical protein
MINSILDTVLRQAAIVLLPLSLVACATSAGRTDPQFGQSARAMLASQVDTGARPARGSAGLDGKAARGAQERYEKSFDNPAPQPAVFTIGLGSGK